ncbi:hypothetical protein D3C81_2153840 [compost metagenome]
MAPSGVCIQDCKASTQNTATNWPTATISTASVCAASETRRWPNSITPRKHDFRMNTDRMP